MKKDFLDIFNEFVEKAEALTYAITLCGLDAAWNAPQGGLNTRNKLRLSLANERFSLLYDEKIGDVLEEISNSDEVEFDLKRKAQLYLRQRNKLASVPKSLYSRYNESLNNASASWQEYKAKSDYKSFEPHLKQLINVVKEMTLCRNNSQSIYDTLLDDNEPGWNTNRYDEFFNSIKTELPPLIKAQKKSDLRSVLYGEYDIDVQRKLMRELLNFLSVTNDWSRLGEGMHPLTTWISENDVRFTTKYRKNSIVDGIISTIHESGHAWYIHNVDKKYDASVIMTDISAAMQESQSRLCENHLGRSYAFWESFYKVLQRYFPNPFSSIPLDKFMKSLNYSQPTLIRTEADELTYPIHIMIRYELEKALFSGEIGTQDLEGAWNELYKKYLGITVPSAEMGVMQDMHWAYGYIGYFPTYALSSAFAAQFDNAMRKDIDVDLLLKNSRYKEIMDYLKENIQRYGALYNSDTILEKATGEKFNPDYYFNYLKTKYAVE